MREELVAAATALLDERGDPSRVSVADVVGRVGVTPPVLYQHFADKDALFTEVHARRWHDFRDAMRRAAARGTTALDRLERRSRAYIRYATARSDAYRALFMTPHRDGSSFNDARVREMSAFDDLVANVRACMDEGSAAPGDAEVAARVVWAQVHGLASILVVMPEVADGVGRAALVERTVAAVTAGLRAP